MRLLITGAGGLLGLNLALQSLKAHSVVGVDRGKIRDTPFGLLQYDLVESGAFDRALAKSRADAVIHCAAMADVDGCEQDPENALVVNGRLPGVIAKACRRADVRLLHISTDAVFDGTSSTPYSEEDRPNPTNVYARTKYAGEAEVLAEYPGAVVARVNFYGWSATGQRSVAEFFVNRLAAGRKVMGFTDVVFCPMLVTDLCMVLQRILDLGLSGLFHVVGTQPMSKYDFGVKIARIFGFDEAFVAPNTVESAGLAAQRGHNLSLTVHKLSTALGVDLPDFSTGLKEFYRQFTTGYPQQLRSYQQSPTQEESHQTGRHLSLGSRSE